MKQQLSVSVRYCYLYTRATQNVSQFVHHWYELEMARAANSPVFGPSAKGFETAR